MSTQQIGKTYRFRLRFHTSAKGLLVDEGKRIDFTLPNGKGATFACVDANSFKEGTRFVITSGDYGSEEEALAYGESLKQCILCFGTKFRIGVDVGKDKASGSLGKAITDHALKEGVRIINDVHGLSVYVEDLPVQVFSVSGAGLAGARSTNFFLTQLCQLASTPKVLNKKIRLAMELVTSSYFETSPRSKFLTLVLAAEALLEPDERSDKVRSVVDELKAHTNASDLPPEEKASIMGTLNWLYKDSISKSLKKMASLHLAERQYGNLPPEKFISKCYDARSKLVHTGAVDESQCNIATLAANLEVYLTQLLTKMTGL